MKKMGIDGNVLEKRGLWWVPAENHETGAVIHKRDQKPGDVYIGRGKGVKNNPANCKAGEEGYFGNPFVLKPGEARGATLDQYQEYFLDRIEKDPEFKKQVESLRGKRLVCFCKPKPCHGDVIVAWLESQDEK